MDNNRRKSDVKRGELLTRDDVSRNGGRPIYRVLSVAPHNAFLTVQQVAYRTEDEQIIMLPRYEVETSWRQMSPYLLYKLPPLMMLAVEGNAHG